MRTTLVRILVPLIVVAAACGRGGADGGRVSDDLRKDLDAASAARPELANATGDFQPMRFVSEIEQSNNATPVQRSRSPRRVAARTANLQQDETQSPAPETAQEIQVAETPAEAPQAPAPTPEAPSVPTVAPRPAALPVDVPAMQGNGGGGGGGIGMGDGRGPGIGDVIGVVIRGGGVGVDHCPPRRRGGRPRFPIGGMR